MLDKTNPLAILKEGSQLSIETMHSWSEEKKHEFKETFEQRIAVAKYILEGTVDEIMASAERRKFISAKHLRQVWGPDGHRHHGRRYHSNYRREIGGRDTVELDEVSKERAKLILSQLPTLKQAVTYIDKETAKNIDARDKLLKKGELLKKKLEDLSEPLKMSDVDDNMTVGVFKKEIKTRARDRKRVFSRMEELGKDGCELEDKINKALYAGLPGLSDAVVKVAKDYLERAKAMEQMSRRVGEQVLFGDSEAAMGLLKGFEADELELEGNIKTEFANAMDALKNAGKKARLSTSKKKAVKRVGTSKRSSKKKAAGRGR